MDLSQRKEQFSNAYVQAVTAVAGFALYKPFVDDDSIDWGIAQRGGSSTIRSPRIELQLKATSSAGIEDDSVKYALKVKNYEDLRHEDFLVPRILVIVVVPKAIDDWLSQSQTELVMRRCGYWASLRGMPPTDNTDIVTIPIPLSQMLDVSQLQAVMRRVGEGGLP